MRTICLAVGRSIIIPLAVSVGLCVAASPASAQGLGVGGRLAWVTAEAEVDRVRFVGGHVRLVSARVGFEVSMDRRSETFDDLDQKVTETPLQASLLLPLGGGSVSPYLLGGPGWYRREVAPIDDGDGDVVRTTEFGWHAGVGLEIRPARRFGIHADYRYTFLDFGDEDEDDEDDGFIRDLLPGHRGSMWTLAATIYF